VTFSFIRVEVSKNSNKLNLILTFYLVRYLCGTTTNIWLRPVQEDLSIYEQLVLLPFGQHPNLINVLVMPNI
jgi:hypothetical protein